MSAKKKTTTGASSKTKGFTPEERAAMRERQKELKAEAKREEGEQTLLAKLAEMPKPDRVLAERIHEIVTEIAPELAPKTWYGMPAYEKDGDVIVFFQSADKFNARYATLGFNDSANLDAGEMWPTSFALRTITDTEEKKIRALVKKAVG